MDFSSKDFAVDHGKWLDRILSTVDPDKATRETAKQTLADEGIDRDELVTAVKGLIVAGAPCGGYSYAVKDYVLRRFCRHRWHRESDGAPASSIRELFDLYVRHGYVRIDQVVHPDSMPTWMVHGACPLEYALQMGGGGLDVSVALIDAGAMIEPALKRRGLRSVDELGKIVFRALEGPTLIAMVKEALMRRTIDAQRPLSTDDPMSSSASISRSRRVSL